jgi:hypothetical protein
MFRRNPFFEAQMKRDPRYRAELRTLVETRVAPSVRRIADQVGAPWMPSGGQAITVEQDGDTVQIANTDHGWAIVEFGSRNNPAHAPLRRGARAAGLRLREE